LSYFSFFETESIVPLQACLIGGLAFLGSVFSAAETAFTASSEGKLKRLSQDDSRASLVLKMKENMGTLISSILLANTWTMTCMTALTTVVMTRLFDEKGALYAAIGVSCFVTIYVEVMPKIYAYPQSETIAMRLAPVFHKLFRFLFPLTQCVDRIARFTLRFLRLYQPQKNDQDPSGSMMEWIHQDQGQAFVIGGMRLSQITAEQAIQAQGEQTPDWINHTPDKAPLVPYHLLLLDIWLLCARENHTSVFVVNADQKVIGQIKVEHLLPFFG